MRLNYGILLIVTLMIASCTTVRIPDTLSKVAPLLRYEDANGAFLFAFDASADELDSVNSQVLGTPTTPKNAKFKDPLPTVVAQETATRKIAESNNTSYQAAKNGKKVSTETELSAGEFEDLGKAISLSILEPAKGEYADKLAAGLHEYTAMVASPGTEVRPSFPVMVYLYYKSYFEGKFVDRLGAKLSKPELGSGVSGETLANIVRIFIECLFDYTFRTPCYFKDDRKEENADIELIKIFGPFKASYSPDDWESFKGKTLRTTFTVPTKDYLLPDGLVPTAVVTRAVESKRICERGKHGVSERELKASRFIVNAVGDQSKVIAGLVIRAFAGLEISFIIGGHFAIGGNEAFATLVETAIEAIVRRTSEALLMLAMERIDDDFGPSASSLKTGYTSVGRRIVESE